MINVQCVFQTNLMQHETHLLHASIRENPKIKKCFPSYFLMWFSLVRRHIFYHSLWSETECEVRNTGEASDSNTDNIAPRLYKNKIISKLKEPYSLIVCYS